MSGDRCSRVAGQYIAIILMIMADAVFSLQAFAKYNDKQRVTVYNNNQAQIEREFIVKDNLPAGSHTINIDGLLAGINDDSVFLRGNVNILDFKIVQTSSKVQLSTDAADKLASLTAQLDKLISTQRDIDFALRRHQEKLESIKRFAENSLVVSSTQNRLSIEDVSAIIQFQDSETEKIDQAILEMIAKNFTINAEKVQLEQAIEVLKASDLSQAPSIQERSIRTTQTMTDSRIRQPQKEIIAMSVRKSVVFQVETKAASSASSPLVFSISYLTQPASWQPDYEINLLSTESQGGNSNGDASSRSRYSLRLDYYANVWQQTTEDWTHTALSLATSSPGYFSRPSLPNKQGVYFNYPRASPRMKNSFPQDRVQMKSAASMRSGAVPEMAMMTADMHIEEGEMVDSPDAEPAMMFQDMSISAAASAVGDLSSTYIFNINYPVNVSSSHHRAGLSTATVQTVQKHRLLLDSTTVDSAPVFTFAVPSRSTQAWLQSWVKYPAEASAPLLAAYNSHVHIFGAYSGTTNVEATQPGGNLKLALGPDKNIQIQTSTVLPTHKGQEEDKSTWFVSDKRKFRVRTEERVSVVSSTYGSDIQLVIVSENLPHSTEENEIKVELLSPDTKELASLAGLENKVGDEDYLAAIVEAELGSPPAGSDVVASSKTAGSNFKVYYNKLSGNLYWVVWTKPGKSISIPFKYKIVWPDEKSAVVY